MDDFIIYNNICLHGFYTYMHQATLTFTAIDFSLCFPNIGMHIDSTVESGLYGSDHFPFIWKFVVGFLMHYSNYTIGILVGRTGCNSIIY